MKARAVITTSPGKLTPTYGLMLEADAVQEVIDNLNEHARALDALEGIAGIGTGFLHVTAGIPDVPADLSGDVVAGAGGVATIQPGVVTTAKMGGDITAAGKALLDDVSAAAQRTTLGLATIATSGSASDLTAGTVAATRMPALTGDVTTSAGSVATAIVGHAVTNAQMAQMAATTIKGNSTGNTADAADLTTAAVKTMLGLVLLNIQVFTSSGTYTPTSGTKRVFVQMTGGGAGGGGVAGGAAASAFAGGGSSGAFFDKFIDPSTTVMGGAVTIGAGGAGGTAGANNGSPGGDTSVVVNGTTYTAKGGLGGIAMSAGATGLAVAGGAPNTGSSSADIGNDGEPGAVGVRLAAGAGWSGRGGSLAFGTGGPPVVAANGDGNPGTGHGSGGSGGGTITTSNQAGGAGQAGKVIVWEFS